MDASAPHRVVIVDGYATGRDLVSKLLDRNVECLHLRSTKEVPAEVGAGFDATPYDADLGYVGDTPEAIELVATLKPAAVVAGSAWGIVLADEISRALSLPGGTRGIAAPRRNKYEAVEAVRAQGLPAVEQTLIWSADSAHIWAASRNQWPVVLKPVDSTTPDSVRVCYGHADIEQACSELLHREVSPGHYNDSLIVQVWLPGPQYVFNTVSLDGRHHVTDAWHKELAEGSNSPWAMRSLHLLDLSLPSAAAAADYAFEVLDTLGIRYGATNTLLKITPQGPVLVNTSSRLMGTAMDQPAYCEVGMSTQAGAYAALLVGTAEERDPLFAAPHFTFRRNLSKVFFTFESAGEIESAEGLQRLKSLPSFYAHYRPLKPGDKVFRSTGPLSCGGTVYLIDEDQSRIKQDIRQLVAWEREGLLYQWRPARGRTDE